MSERLNSFTKLMVYLGGAKMYMASDPTPFMDDAQEYVAQLEAELAAEIDIRNQYIAERDRLAEEIVRLRELLGGDARHYVDCYHLQFPDAGAGFVVQEIDALLEGKDGE